MRIAYRLLPAILACAGLVGAPTLRATDMPLQERTQGSIAYLSGGIGSDEAEAMRRAAASYPLMLELAAPSGGSHDAYVANAKIEVRDQRGNALLSTTAEGPLVLIRLPAGRYTVEAAWNGAVKRQAVDIATGKPQRVVFEFPPEHATP